MTIHIDINETRRFTPINRIISNPSTTNTNSKNVGKIINLIGNSDTTTRQAIAIIAV